MERVLVNSTENPHFYIRYVYNRSRNILSILEKEGYNIFDFTMNPTFGRLEANKSLIFKILELEEVVDEALKFKEPYKVFIYLQDLARDFHEYNNSLFIRDQSEEEIVANIYTLKVIERFTYELMDLLEI